MRTPGGHRLVVLPQPPEVQGIRQAVRQTTPVGGARPSGSPTSIDACGQAVVVYVAVLGDFNDTPSPSPSTPCSTGRTYVTSPPTPLRRRRPTRHIRQLHRLAEDRLPPAVPGLVRESRPAAASHRLGAWGGKNGTLWPHYDTLTKAIDAASDHSAIYAESAGLSGLRLSTAQRRALLRRTLVTRRTPPLRVNRGARSPTRLGSENASATGEEEAATWAAMACQGPGWWTRASCGPAAPRPPWSRRWWPLSRCSSPRSRSASRRWLPTGWSVTVGMLPCPPGSLRRRRSRRCSRPPCCTCCC